MPQSIAFVLFNVAGVSTSSKSGISTAALVGAIVGAIAAAVILSAIVSLLILRKHTRKYHTISRKRRRECLIITIQCLHKSIIIFSSVVSIVTSSNFSMMFLFISILYQPVRNLHQAIYSHTCMKMKSAFTGLNDFDVNIGPLSICSV